jgi:hypothetical protein
MLAPHEFTVGSYSDAEPLSLILPRTEYEFPALVGSVNEQPAAILLAGRFAFHFFECAGNDRWKGLIVPNIRVEVDQTSLLAEAPLGSVVREGTSLAVRGKREEQFDNGAVVVLHDGLVSTGNHKAAFGRWQVVIGEGPTKRVLWHAFDKSIEVQTTG